MYFKGNYSIDGQFSIDMANIMLKFITFWYFVAIFVQISLGYISNTSKYALFHIRLVNI